MINAKFRLVAGELACHLTLLGTLEYNTCSDFYTGDVVDTWTLDGQKIFGYRAYTLMSQRAKYLPQYVVHARLTYIAMKPIELLKRYCPRQICTLRPVK